MVSIAVFALGLVVGLIWGRYKWLPKPGQPASRADRVVLANTQREYAEVLPDLSSFNKALLAKLRNLPGISGVDVKDTKLTSAAAMRECELILMSAAKRRVDERLKADKEEGLQERRGPEEKAPKPDYGLRLKRDGRDSSVDMHFHAFAVYSLTVLSRGRYSTCVDIPYAGQRHAMSLDFGPEHLEAILSRGSPRLRMFVKSQLDQDPATPRTIDFPEPVYCSVRARLGEEQQGKYENFMPLNVQSISDSVSQGE